MSGGRNNTHRCSACDIDWPFFHMYTACPVCDRATWQTYSDDPLTPSQAAAYIAKRRNDEEKAKEYAAKVEEFNRIYADRAAAELQQELTVDWMLADPSRWPSARS